MSAQRNSLNGKTKAPEPVESVDSAPPMVISEKSKVVFSSPLSLYLVIAGCCAAAVLWATLRGDVSKNGFDLVEHGKTINDHAQRFIKVDSKLDSLDYRTTTLEEAMRSQKAMADDMRVVRAILEQQLREQRERFAQGKP